MFYSDIENNYYGIEIAFSYAPIQNFPTKNFIISTHDLLVLLAQSWPMIYELVQTKLEFTPIPFLLKATTPPEWLDFATLLRQGKHNPRTTPKVTLDVGGRKIFSYIPSDKYCYDCGELPLYVVRTNVPIPGKLAEKTSIVVLEWPHEAPVVSNPDLPGKNSIKNESGKERLSYIDFYLSLEKHYGSKIDHSAIVNECRHLLSGGLLNANHAPILPVMLATMFGAEVSRNRACLLTGLMLFDLIEYKVMAPSCKPEKQVYSFENALWHPELYHIKSKERRNDDRNRLGGFFPMAHQGSWEEEFKEEGPYQHQFPLSRSHVKSIVILIDWLCHLHPSFLPNMTITRLTKNDYEIKTKLAEEKFKRKPTAISGNAQLYQANNLVVARFLHGLIQKRLYSFDSMPLKYSHYSEDANKNEADHSSSTSYLMNALDERKPDERKELHRRVVNHAESLVNQAKTEHKNFLRTYYSTFEQSQNNNNGTADEEKEMRPSH